MGSKVIKRYFSAVVDNALSWAFFGILLLPGMFLLVAWVSLLRGLPDWLVHRLAMPPVSSELLYWLFTALCIVFTCPVVHFLFGYIKAINQFSKWLLRKLSRNTVGN